MLGGCDRLAGQFVSDETVYRLGLFLMAKAGYDTRAAVELWRRMDRLGQGRAPLHRCRPIRPRRNG
jgi:hypothetical protein